MKEYRLLILVKTYKSIFQMISTNICDNLYHLWLKC